MTITGWLAKNLCSTYNHTTGYNVCSYIFIQSRQYAARKGTREKAKKKKVKKVIEKVGFVVPKKADLVKKHTASPLVTLNDEWKAVPCDDVWIRKFHRKPIYNFGEAIENHREALHPTMLNAPNAPIYANIALDMRGIKKNKYVEKFSGLVDTPHVFNSGESLSTVLAFCKSPTEQEIARNAGADFVGGPEVIKEIQNGTFNMKDYDSIVAHADILAELLLIRGLLKRRFPNVRTGTLSSDIRKLVLKQKHGIRYKAIPDEQHKDYGEVKVIFGLLDMDTNSLKENLSAIINDVQTRKPVPDRPFIQNVDIASTITREYFKIDLNEFIPLENVEPTEEETEDNIAIISTH